MSNWLKTVPKKLKYKSLRQPGEWWCPSILLGSTDLTWAIPESKSGKTLLSIRTDLYNGEVTPIDRKTLWWRLNHLSQYVKLYEDVTPILYQISQKWSEMISYSKGANKFSVVWKRTVLGRLRSPLPDQLWLIERTGLWWSRSQWRSYNSIGLPIHLAKWVCQVSQRR